jgi:hypothetical protein
VEWLDGDALRGWLELFKLNPLAILALFLIWRELRRWVNAAGERIHELVRTLESLDRTMQEVIVFALSADRPRLRPGAPAPPHKTRADRGTKE